jgi:hypothetical protein
MLLVAGCGTQVDTAKVTYPRTTVPAGQAPPAETSGGETPVAKPNDPAFTPEKLRVVEPCGVLDEDLLAEVGQPEESKHNDFNECANYMADDEGRELNITLTLGVTVTNAVDANQNIGGLPALEDPLEGGDACFVTVVTSTSPNLGMTVQVGGPTETLCDVGRTVMTSVVERIRTDPPTYDLAKGTLIDLDPCTLLRPDALTEPLGGEVEPRPFDLNQCSWRSPVANLTVRLLLGYDPGGSGDGSPVDLGGGITGYQEKTVAAGASCELEWTHRPFAGDDVERVSVTYEKQAAEEGEDPCVAAQAIAKTLVTALPKA